MAKVCIFPSSIPTIPKDKAFITGFSKHLPSLIIECLKKTVKIVKSC